MKKVSYATDAIALVGFAALLFGIWRVHPPSAWIVGGAFTLAFAIFVSSQPPQPPGARA